MAAGRRRLHRLGNGRLAAGLWVALLCGLTAVARAQTTSSGGAGFQLNRYEPTAAGEWSFAVDHPWYSATRYVAAGLTVNYGHDPLVVGYRNPDGSFQATQPIIAHQLLGHLDLAGSFLNRVLLTLSLPVTLLERGNDGSNGVSLVSRAAVGDPRLGAMVRLYGQPDASPLSLSLGFSLWIPINSGSSPPFPAQVGESGVRVMPKLILGGLQRSIRWSFTAGYLYRPTQSLGSLPPGSGNSVGPELQLGAAIAYAHPRLGLAVGPEVLLATVVSGGHAFHDAYTSLELLVGAHLRPHRLLQLGLAGGLGLLREPGTPDGRLLFRIAYAPLRDTRPKDRDHDGVFDPLDGCPDVPGVPSFDPQKNGCPPPDSDSDGILDPDDSCPDEAMGQHPDPTKHGCPLRDRDSDGVYDEQDRCPEVAAGPSPDPEQPGCPLRDQDSDGVFDPQDLCKEVAAGPHPDPNRRGCPDSDSDGDGVYDAQDRCKETAAGLFPDPAQPGCPLSDRDHDSIPDGVDACPDQPGAPAANPKKHGCPGLVEVRGDQIVILRQVFFATNRDTILKKSFGLLDSVAQALKMTPGLKKVVVEGHTDNAGQPEPNRELSERRAQSVLRYLVEHGVEASRLSAKGYGPDRPAADNKTAKGRAKNRRTEFRIVDPAPAPAASPPATNPPAASTVAPPETTPEPPAKGKGKGKGKKPQRRKPAAT